MRGGSRLAASVLLSIGLWAPPTKASEDTVVFEQGPFTERNQFAFNALFLSFPARGGALLPPGEQQILLTEDYTNTFAASDIFLAYETEGRTEISPGRVAFLQTLRPGEDLFFVDGEQWRTALTYRCGLARRFELGAELLVLSTHGGMLDSLIESYHQKLGFGDAGRVLYKQDIVQIALTMGGEMYFSSGSNLDVSLGDLTLSGRLALADSPRASAALTLAVKLPTGKPEALSSSGGLDEGLEAEATWRWGRQRLHLAGGWVHTGEWDLFPDFGPANLFNGLAGYEYVSNERLSWIGQVQTQSSVFKGRPQADSSLRDLSTEILAGARWQTSSRRCFFQAAVIENLFEQYNGVDFGLLAGLGVRFAAKGESAKPRVTEPVPGPSVGAPPGMRPAP